MSYLTKIQTVVKLLSKGVVVDDEFAFCHVGGETADHLLVLCLVVKGIWEDLFSWFNQLWVPPLNVKEAITVTKDLASEPPSMKGKLTAIHLPRAI